MKKRRSLTLSAILASMATTKAVVAPRRSENQVERSVEKPALAAAKTVTPASRRSTVEHRRKTKQNTRTRTRSIPASNPDGLPVSSELEEALRVLKEEVLGTPDAFRPLPVLPRSTYESASSELDEVFRVLREEILYTYPGIEPTTDLVMDEVEPVADLVQRVTEVELTAELVAAEIEPVGDLVMDFAEVRPSAELDERSRQATDDTEPEADLVQDAGVPVEAAPEPVSLDEYRDKKRGRTHAKRRRAVVAGIAAAVALVLGVGGGAAYAYFTAQGKGSGPGHAVVGSVVALTVTTTSGAPDLVPGGTGAVSFKVTNPNPFGVKLSAVTSASVLSNNTAACPSADVSIAQALPYALTPAISLAANATSAATPLPNLVKLSVSAPSTCQGVTFKVTLSFSGVSS